MATPAKAREKRRYQVAIFNAADKSSFEFLVDSKDGQSEGLFPIGEISVFAGPSGAWKTKVFLDFVTKWRKGEPWFGHRTIRGSGKFCIVSFDRSKPDFERTARYMGFDPNDFNLIDLGDDEYNASDPLDVIENIVNQPEFLGLRFVFVEGLDLKAGDMAVAKDGKLRASPNVADANCVAMLMRGLKKLAMQNRFAVIVSMGSPKQKQGAGYTAKRDLLIGSQAWGRMANTIVALELVQSKDDQRSMSVLPRNGPPEMYTLVLDESGRPIEGESSSEGYSAWEKVRNWLILGDDAPKAGEVLTTADIKARFDMADATAGRALKQLAGKVNLIRKLDHGKWRVLEPSDSQKFAAYLSEHRDATAYDICTEMMLDAAYVQAAMTPSRKTTPGTAPMKSSNNYADLCGTQNELENSALPTL